MVMYPLLRQVIGYRGKGGPIGGLILDPKDDYAEKVIELAACYGRRKDVVIVGLDSDVIYNPMQNILRASARAHAIAALIEQTSGKEWNPYWKRAYSNAINFMIELCELAYDYVTLKDVADLMTRPDVLEKTLADARRRIYGETYYLITQEEYRKRDKTAKKYATQFLETTGEAAPWDKKCWKLPHSYALIRWFEQYQVPHATVHPATGLDPRREQVLGAVEDWYTHRWQEHDSVMKNGIVESAVNLLSIFSLDPDVRRLFCPDKETWLNDPKVLRSFAEGIEAGKLYVLRFPTVRDAQLARMLAIMLKLDFEQAVLSRLEKIQQAPERDWPYVLMMVDEFGDVVTAGANEPVGDDNTFRKGRASKLIPIVAFQSWTSLSSALQGVSWRDTVGHLRTKIICAQADEENAAISSGMCGKRIRHRRSVTIQEQGQDARRGMLTWMLESAKSSVGLTTGYTETVEPLFDTTVFLSGLRNGEAICLPYDGRTVEPPTRLYLKPEFESVEESYFEQVEAGKI
jgi:TraM recognition site of TraD and TraG